MKFKLLIQILTLFFPWSLRRPILNLLSGFEINKTAYIGKSLILCHKLKMQKNSRIGSLSICKGIDFLHVGAQGRIGTLNYITGFTTKSKQFFSHKKNRKCHLVIGNHSAITSRHFIDCTDQIIIGDFTTIAGVRSQIFTHSINLKDNIQDCYPVKIGSFNFIGSNSVILPGSVLPDYSILGAKSLLQTQFKDTHSLYGGVPAKKVKSFEKDQVKYFHRKVGFVN